MFIAIFAGLLSGSARAADCSEDADECLQLGNATIERAGEFLYVECTSACAVGVSGERINAITVTEGSGSITLSHNITAVTLIGSEDSDVLDASGSPVPATIFGGSGPDSILGTFQEDVIRGGYGNDRIDGLDGVDTIRGGRGNDTLIGGTGLDVLIGGRGMDDCQDGAILRRCEVDGAALSALQSPPR